jgi:hypothetical protein
MANSTSGDSLWTLDTVGLISQTPITVRKIIYIPSAAADDVLINTYTNSEVALGAGSNVSTTFSNPDGTSCRMAVGGTALPSAVADGYVLDLLATEGTSTLGKYLVKTAGNNTQADFWGQFVAESSKVSSWRTLTSRTALVLKAGASDASPVHVDFGPHGKAFENFILETIDGGTLYVHLL